MAPVERERREEEAEPNDAAGGIMRSPDEECGDSSFGRDSFEDEEDGRRGLDQLVAVLLCGQ